MKYILLLLLSLNAYGQAKPVSMKGQADSGYTLPKQEIQVPNKQYTNTGGLSGLIELENFNLLANPGFEASTYSSGWTLGGTGTHAAEVAQLMFGVKAAGVTTSAQTFSFIQDSTLYASVFASSAPQGYVRAWIYNTASGATMCARSAGVTLTGNNCVTLAVGTAYKFYEIPVVLGGTSNGLEISSASTTGTTIVDQAYVGVSPGAMPEVAQAQYGSSYRTPTASCIWTRTNTTFGAPAAVAACPGPTINGAPSFGTWSTTDTDLPDQTLTNAPLGRYVVKAKTSLNNGTAGQFACAAVSDGTTTGQGACSSVNDANDIFEVEPFLDITYTDSATRTFTVHLKSNSGSADMEQTANGAGLQFEIVYYPPASKIYSQACSDPRACENEFSAALDSTGVTTNENLDFINGNAASGGTGIKTITWNTGIFTVAPNCALTVEGGSSTSNELHVEMTSVSSTTLVYETASTGADSSQAIRILCQKAPPDYKAQNQITGTFANVVTAPGISKPKTCYYAFGGASATLAAPTVCSTGTCVEVVDTCGAGSPPTFSTTGIYLNMTFASGTWANSSFVKCDCVSFDAASGNTRDCTLYWETGDQTWATNSSGGYVMNMSTSNNPGTLANTHASLECTGQAP